MDMKNTTILLIFLLCIMGLMIGVYQTESSDNTVNLDDYDEVVKEDSNGTVTIDLVLKQNNESSPNKLFT
ncbi:MAG: hypothetical protein IJ287_08670 [Methanobrevibacter sp.]|nr:hypothetical protein [Methanobrevibacter sp.]